jgi:glycosyltransferase involved in cell wall biosynthesis
MPAPQTAILVSSYQRPRHLLRVLASIACQQHVQGRFEVVVTDDGSTDETPRIVAQFARQVDFRVAFTTHRHTTYQLARCRNEGVRASSAPYLLFLDGDCLIPPDHIWQHLMRCRRGVVMAGYCALLDEATTERVCLESIYRGEYLNWVPPSEWRKLARIDRKARLYNLLRHPTKPKLYGGNIGIWRSDFEAVNGYDENYEGWGCEDDDLRLRLRQAGMRIRSILRWTRTYHLWHARGETTPLRWKDGANVGYLRRGPRLARCRNGLWKPEDGHPHDTKAA